MSSVSSGEATLVGARLAPRPRPRRVEGSPWSAGPAPADRRPGAGYATACSFFTIAGSISMPNPGVSGSVTTPRSTFMPPEQKSTAISW